MPTNITIPKFLTHRGAEPKWTTEEYWARFQYSIISAIKSKPDDLMTKSDQAAATDATVTLTTDEQLYMEVLKGAFLEALGEDAISEIQQRNPKEKVYLQSVGWIKIKWEECYRSSRNVTENLVKMWNGTRPKDTTILQHWMEIGEKVAQCKLDSMTAQDIEEHIHVAAFLSTVNEPKEAKSLWEKKGTKAGLAEYIRATAEAESEIERIQKKNDKDKSSDKSSEASKVNEEPVGKISHQKSRRPKKGKDGSQDKKEKNCSAAANQTGHPITQLTAKLEKPNAKDAEKSDTSKNFANRRQPNPKINATKKKSREWTLQTPKGPNIPLRTRTHITRTPRKVSRKWEKYCREHQHNAQNISQYAQFDPVNAHVNCTEPEKNSNSKSVSTDAQSWQYWT